jgi:NAD(P)-dependent dehydrogenase (short-subunit alcohol dehydrogenase family)
VNRVTPNATVLLIGASRSLGYEIVAEYINRGSDVVATVRGSDRTLLHDLLDDHGGQLEIEQVDITCLEEFNTLRQRLGARRCDPLFVNAGIANRSGATAEDVTDEEFIRLMVTNSLSPMRVIELLDEVVNPNGTIAIMSSGQGSIANNERGGYEIYRASKPAFNQLMRSYAARHRGGNRTLLLMAPGWVGTELGSPHAPLSIKDSIPTLMTTVHAQGGHFGLQFLDYFGKTVPW